MCWKEFEGTGCHDGNDNPIRAGLKADVRLRESFELSITKLP
jgi:hypothetical protein